MYKCKECSKEYEEKPDYCDCGNDEFDEFNLNSSAGIDKAADILQEIPEMEESKPTVSPAHSDGSFKTKLQSKQDFNLPFNIPSMIIFSVCILLSLYIIFFAWNPKDNAEVNIAENKEVQAERKIPSIDKFWDNTLPIEKQQSEKQEDVKPAGDVQNIIKQVIPIAKPIEQKKNTVVPKITTVPLKKAANKTTKKQAVSQKTSVKAQPQTKPQAPSAEETTKKKAEQERLAAEAAHLKALQEAQAKKSAQEKAIQAEAAKQEFINYKAQLRNTIGRKIDFTRVIGDGSCTVSFRIDSNGKLTNRSFSKQSSNNTLNDTVYNAVMATPVFNPPPSGYNNEILNLNIRFNNGNFEISLP